ncbi:MAG TPA: CehA/McbA family metallohydrolase [Anaerolineae bacterium]|nr:CehA/McbA family metallohydrolase [Anaerolineae bacterium]
MPYSVDIGRRRFWGLRGNLHIHTTDSDGHASLMEVARIARAAGLDFVIITDHNVYRPGLDQWVGDTLVLVGEEVHDPRRAPQSSHTLCLNIQEDVASRAGDPQALLDAVNDQGGFAFLAHPFEHDSATFLLQPNISWRDWRVSGYAGIELWNYMSEFKALLRSKAQALFFSLFPSLAISGPYRESLQKWDSLLRSGPVSVVGGSDAHSSTYRLGPITRMVHPYAYLFRCVNTHVLSQEPPSGDLAHAKSLVYHGLRAGASFVGYERLAPVAGFSFWARSGDSEATMGETLPLRRAVELRIDAPDRALLRLLRDGQVVAQSRGRSLAAMAPRPGVYRAEAYRTYAGRMRGWIFSNPIYVKA